MRRWSGSASEPNGLNINERCGSNEPALLRETVLREGADLGVALDGDADRLVLVDDRGAVIDGDQVLGLIAGSWRDERLLRGEAVVATVMSNLGLEQHLAGLGLALHRTRVGDRYVVERMRADGCNVGGEQSGHIILSDFATTGDGLLAALQVLAVLRRRDRPASEVAPRVRAGAAAAAQRARAAPARPRGARGRGPAGSGSRRGWPGPGGSWCAHRAPSR